MDIVRLSWCGTMLAMTVGMAPIAQPVVIDSRTLENEALVCTTCASLVGTAHPLCLECATPRPATGWGLLLDEFDPWLGRTIAGRYLIAQRLGVGGTARVYRADSLRVPRRFGLKIVELLPGSGAAAEERAQREVAAVSQLRGPHIVPVYEFVRLGARAVGIVMGYADGVTLQQWIRERGPLTVEQALDVARQVAEGLEEAHLAGIVHRDIKPDNLMLQELPSGDLFVRIMDFGIAHVEGTEQITTGFLGTPHYASPEQVMGDPISPATDAYGLGATLYAALTGSPPFTRDTNARLLRAHVLDAAPRLSDAAGRYFAGAVEQLVASLLAKRASDRPQTMREVMDEIDLLRDTPGWSDVIGDSMRESSELLAVSETVSEARDTVSRRSRPSHCTDLEMSRGDATLLTALAPGRVASLRPGGILVTNLSPRREQYLDVPFADRITALAMTNSSVFVATRDGLLRRDEDGEWPVMFATPDGSLIEAISASACGDVVAVGTSSGDVYLRTRAGEWQRFDAGSRVRALALSPSGALVAVATWEKVRVLEVDGAHAIELDSTGAAHVCFSADEYLLAITTQAGRVGVWSVVGRQTRHLYSMTRERGRLLGLHFASETLLGLCRDEDAVFLVDLQCQHGMRCTPECSSACRQEH